MNYYVIPNAAGDITGSGSTPDGTIPAGAVPCTSAQASNFQQYAVNSSGVVPAPAAQLLAQAQAVQIGILAQAYANAIAQPVSYTSKGGVTKTYQADPASIGNLQNMLLACSGAAATPAGFYWVAADNTQVTFTLADLQGLAAAMGAQGFAAFAHLQTLKTEVRAASDPAAVAAIVW